MDDRLSRAAAQKHVPPTIPLAAAAVSSVDGVRLDDPRILQVLSAEHWGLLSARSLVYNEAFARAGMFLTFVSASFVALALAANAMAFDHDFLLLAAGLLTLDLLIGLTTVGRLLDVVRDDLRAIHGMNRIRHAYAELAPEVVPYLVMSTHDDAAGVMATYGGAAGAQPLLPAFLHGLTTTNSMVSVINAVLAGAIAGLLVVILGSDATIAAAATLVVLGLVFVVESRLSLGLIRRFEAGLESRFPTPPID